MSGNDPVLTASQVASFVHEMPGEHGYDVLIELLAYGGLRWGEVAALRRGRCELLRRRLDVVESLADVNGKLIFQSTKTYERRYVSLPARVVENLAQHLNTVSVSAETLVFTSGRGTPLRNQNFRRSYFNPAASAPASRPRSHRTGCATLAQASSSTKAPTP